MRVRVGRRGKGKGRPQAETARLARTVLRAEMSLSLPRRQPKIPGGHF